MRRHRTVIAMLAFVLFSPGIAKADVVLEWNAIMLTTVGGQNPFAQAGFAAITQLAVFEAVNACTRDHEPYLGTVTAQWGASAEAAAVAAAYGVLRQYFPASAATLDAARTRSLAAIPDGQGKYDGVAVGEAAAAAMIAARTHDGAAPPEFFLPEATDPGVWRPTPPAFSPGILLHWRNVTPFGIRSSDQFRSAPPPALAGSRYRRDYNEVMRVGAFDGIERPQDRTEVARYFAVASPAHVWNLVVQQASAAHGLSLSENARVFALLNMAISDASVSVFETKYFYVFWRPVTAIRGGDTDGNPHTNPDPGWTPFITTPAFPGYPSAHASASNAARRVAERFFGNGDHAFTLPHPATPEMALNYGTFRDITEDIDDARVYGGIHFRFDQEAGARQGRRVGAWVYTHNLRRLHRGGDRDDGR